VLAAARYANARRHVARVIAWIEPHRSAWVRFGLRALASPWPLAGFATLVRKPGRLRRAYRVLRRIDRRHGFLVSSRAAAAIACYARGLALMRRQRPAAVLVSGDTHPEDLGLAGAARVLGVPQIFVSHAYPTPYAPRLRFSLSILEGQAALEARRRAGQVEGGVILAGLEGESAVMDPYRVTREAPVVGVFAPKAVSWETFAAIVTDCRARFRPSAIVVRWHPSMFERPRLAEVVADTTGIVESASTASLAEVARRCDWVIADENSNVHLAVLKLGIPTIAVRRMGLYPDSRADLYGFAARGVIPPAVGRLSDVAVDAVLAFYSGTWPERFRGWDAAYLRGATEVRAEVREAVGRLLAGAGEGGHG
jgi:hypothetical protein